MLIRKGGTLVLGAGLVLLTGGCPLLEIEAEVPEVCVTYTDIEIPGAEGQGQLSKSVVFDDLSAVRELEELDANVEFLHVVLRAKSGVDSFDFLEAAHVTIASADPASTLPTLTIVDCADGSCVSDGSPEMKLASDQQSDALAYARAGALLVNVDVSGTLPEAPWKMDVDVCVKARVRYAYEP